MEIAANVEDEDPMSVSQQEVRRHWEEKFAAEDRANLFPRPSSAVLPARRQSSGRYNADDVDTQPMEDMSTIKRQWESKMLLETPPDDVVVRKTSSSCGETDGSECDGGDTSLNNNTIYSNSVRSGSGSVEDAATPSYESAIERDIRLAQEREREFRREHERVQNAANANETPPPQKQKPKTRVDVARRPSSEGRSPVMVVPSPAAKSVRSPQPQPQPQSQPAGNASNDVRRDGVVIRQKSRNSNGDASWRTEKDNSRLSIGSIVEREIRMQQDRETEIAQLRASVYHTDDVDSQPKPKPDTRPTQRDDVTPKRVSLPPPVLVKSAAADSPVVTAASPRSPEPARPTSPRRLEIKVSTYRTSGEVIASELREYEEREAELRQRWVAMGLDVPKSSISSPASDASGADRATSPVDRPRPGPGAGPGAAHPQQQQQQQQQQNGAVLSDDGSDGGVAARTRRTSTTDSEASADSGRFHRLLRVRPITDDADGADAAPTKYVPRTETPIEREMRLAQERENELRCQRGLTPVTRPRSEAAAAATTTPADGDLAPLERFRLSQTGTRPSDGERMKRFSSGRLQSEIERDRQKELQLRDEGKITTMSDERAAKPAVYSDAVPH